MNFSSLQVRLLHQLQARLRDGEWTERGLARRIGVSQPHVHNVLCGVRPLTPEMADQILAHLGLDLLTVAEPDELRQALEKTAAIARPEVAVPVAAGYLGPGQPCPGRQSISEWINLEGWHANWAARLREPLFVRLGDDADLEWSGPRPQLVLLETEERARRKLVPEAWYAIRTPQGGAVRELRWEPPTLTVLGQMSLLAPTLGQEFVLNTETLDRVVLGRVEWAGPAIRRGFDPGQALWPKGSW